MTATPMSEQSEAATVASCIHAECDRSPDPEVAGLACCMACAMAWGARTTPVHIGRCDRRSGGIRRPSSKQWIKVGTVLRGDYGPSVIVGPDHDALDGLVMLLEYEYGGTFTRDHPGLAEIAASLSVETWRSCTKAWRESNICNEYADDWWTPDGDGARTVRVVFWCLWEHNNESIYNLGARVAPVADEAPEVQP